MANITKQNSIRYNIDTLDNSSSGVFIYERLALDCSNADTVKGFDLSYNEPSRTHIKIFFQCNNTWGKLTSAGTFEEITQTPPDFETINFYGNTPAELTPLTNIPEFAGQTIGVALALSSEDPSNALPKIKISAKCESNSQILNTSRFSPVYNFDDAQLIKFNNSAENSGSGNVAIYGQVKDKNGNLSEWLPVDNLNGKQITALQLRADYSVSDLNSTANLTKSQAVFAQSNSITSGAVSGDIISLTENWFMNLRECRLTIKHDALKFSDIKTFISLRKAPSIIHGEQLGIGNGSRKTFQLQNTKGIKYDTVKLFFDNVQTFSDYEINTQVGRITCTAPDGVIVSCDYEYNWQNETWHELILNSRISFMDYDQSEYKLTLDNGNYSVCAVKISLVMNEGKITREKIGTGTGKTQTYKLSRLVNDGVITIYENSTALPAKNFKLHDDTQYISITADNGKTLYASYNWISEPPVIHQFAAVFSE